jgi:Flp pilus assembly protein TadD
VERIERPGRSLLAFQPGDDLADYAVSFVRSAASSDVHVTSHYERLWLSRCKQQSGDRLWCGSCHDSHGGPSGSGKCLTCHEQPHSDGDCIACHMPSRPASDARLTRFTDHAIPRDLSKPRATESSGLQPFGGAPAGARELGMALARIAHREGKVETLDRAFALLKQARADGAGDADFLTLLAWLYDRSGDETTAADMYELVRRKDPSQAEVAVNLGAIYVKRKRVGDAIRLWQEALAANPGIEDAWIKLASAYLAMGDHAAARKALAQCLEIYPDSPAASGLLKELQP